MKTDDVEAWSDTVARLVVERDAYRALAAAAVADYERVATDYSHAVDALQILFRAFDRLTDNPTPAMAEACMESVAVGLGKVIAEARR